jgi:PEP-CTERM motif
VHHKFVSLRTRATALVAVTFFGIDVARAVDFSIGQAEVVYSKSQRSSHGGTRWPDGSLGVVSNGDGTYDFYGPNGSNSVHTSGTLDNPGAAKQSVSIIGIPKKTFSYVAGGPIFEDTYSGSRLMIYHAEDGGKGKSFYGMLGMAVSTDGRTFHDLGLIIKPTQTSGNAEVGGGSFAIVNGCMNVYYTDWTADGNMNSVSVARASMADLMNNALAGRSTAFNKYYEGGWSESGLGGKSSYLETGNPANSWLGVSYNEYLNQVVMVSSQWADDGGDLYITTSSDGVNWAPRQPLAVDPGEQFYPSIIGTGPDPSRTGQSFYAYYTDSKKGTWGRWKDAQLRRREINITSAPDSTGSGNSLGYTANWDSVGNFQSDFQSGTPAAGWKYAWDPKGKVGKQSEYVPLLWSESAQAYNSTGGATTVPNPKSHHDDFLSLAAGTGHPGQSKYLPMAGYTIQADDGAGYYRLTDTSIQLADTTPAAKDDGLSVRVYVNDLLIGSAQSVPFGSGIVNFDRMLGSLNVGDTVWVMIDPLKNNNDDSFINFNFSLERLVYSAQSTLFAAGLQIGTTVPEPSSAALILLGLAAYCLRRRR